VRDGGALEDRALALHRHCITGDADHPLHEEVSGARMPEHDDLAARRASPAQAELVHQEVIAQGQRWKPGGGRRSEGLVDELAL
jgi:hypothetical protein